MLRRVNMFFINNYSLLCIDYNYGVINKNLAFEMG